MNKGVKVILFFFLSSTISFCQTDLERGIKFFDARAEKHEGLKVDSTNINQAIFHFKESIKKDVKAEKSTDYLILCYYYKAAFVVRTKKEQKRNYLIGKNIGASAIKKYPNNKGILLWYIANYSKYGEMQGVVASAKNGLADKIKTLTEKLLEIDPEFSDGSAYRILGVLNYKVPYIPLIITWPSKSKAEEQLKKALKINPKAISNLYYYAEFLVEEKRDAEAKVILSKLFQIQPRKTALIEDMYDISMAKKLKNKIK